MSEPKTNTLWGGRFAAGPDALMEAINASIGFDRRLYACDIAGSKAHAAMLAECGIISEEDAAAIGRGLDTILQEIESGNFEFSAALEDIHMNVEARLAELIGPPAGRLHTARSRNDQVATDLRLWVRGAIDGLDADLKDLQSALIDRAEAHADTVMPGFTHLQSAQPVTFGHHMLAYAAMFGRDRARLADARGRVNESPLGAAALAGTSFPIDRAQTAAALGFDRPMANSLDAVSARDFALEFLAACAICATHLSRLAEEIVVWSSAQFGFIGLSDSFSTGSSIMPQKRNPDAAELVRAKAGRIVGALTGLAVVMKGLPLAYSKDMQEDKEPVFDAADSLAVCVRAMSRHDPGDDGERGQAVRRRRRRIRDRDRSRGLAGARARPAVPRRPPRHRRAGEAGRSARRRSRRPDPRRDAERRAAGDGGCFRRADGAIFRRQPDVVRRHRAGQCPGGGGCRARGSGRARRPVTGDGRMVRVLTILLAAGALGLAPAACGKKDDPRSATGVDRYPAGYPAGAPAGAATIFRKHGPE